MKGRIEINGAVHTAVHIACDADLITIYRTKPDGLEMLLTLIRARLLPTDSNTLTVEGFARKAGTGDPEQSEPRQGDEYIFQSLVFTPEPMASYSVSGSVGEDVSIWRQSLN